MKSVVIRAPLLSTSGYGEHSRQIFKFLLTKPNLNVVTQVVPWGITPWNVNEAGFNHLAGEVMRRTASSSDQKFDISFQVQLPNEWDTTLARFNVGVTAGVETDRCNPMWTSVHCEKMDLVIVPSLHTKKTLESSATCRTPIVVIPEHYFSELEEDSESLDLDLGTDFNFLTIGVLTGMTPSTDRKNLFYLIKWFAEEFRKDHDVGLIIKTNRGRETSIDKCLTTAVLQKVLQEVGHQGVPKIYLLHGDMSRRDMSSLYKHPSVKALVSTTRGEGFGLPHLEATIAGLPVIATNWSAHTEFLGMGKWVKLEYDLVEIDKSRQDGNIFMAGTKWADVHEDSFKRAIRKFRGSHTVPKAWANDLSKILRDTHSEKSVFKKYECVLGEILS